MQRRCEEQEKIIKRYEERLKLTDTEYHETFKEIASHTEELQISKEEAEKIKTKLYTELLKANQDLKQESQQRQDAEEQLVIAKRQLMEQKKKRSEEREDLMVQINELSRQNR